MEDYKDVVLAYANVEGLLTKLVLEAEDMLMNLKEASTKVLIEDDEAIKELASEINSTQARLDFLNSEGLLERWNNEYLKQFEEVVPKDKLEEIISSMSSTLLLNDLEVSVGIKLDSELELATQVKPNGNLH